MDLSAANERLTEVMSRIERDADRTDVIARAELARGYAMGWYAGRGEPQPEGYPWAFAFEHAYHWARYYVGDHPTALDVPEAWQLWSGGG